MGRHGVAQAFLSLCPPCPAGRRMQVCSQWRRVAHDERLWYRLYTRADFLVSPASRAGESWKLVRHAWRQAAASHAPGLTCTGSRSQHPSLVITALSKLAPVAAPALHEDGRFGWCVVRRCAWRRDVPFQRSEVGALQLCGRSSLQGGSLVPHRHLLSICKHPTYTSRRLRHRAHRSLRLVHRNRSRLQQ